MTAAARPWAFVTPALAIAGVWILAPLALTALVSLSDWNVVTDAVNLVGADNYAGVLSNPDDVTSFVNSGLYALGILPPLVLLPIPVAVALWRYGGRLEGVYRLAIFFPVLVAPVIAAYLWQWLLNPSGGLLPAAVGAIGLQPPELLQSRGSALWTIVGLTIWKAFGLGVVLYAAALSAVDGALIDAARTDGASEWQTLRHVLIPLLRPTAAVVAFLTLIHSSQWSFAFVHVLTQGGPVQATTNVLYRIYQVGLVDFDAGHASALGVLVVACFGVLSAVVLRFGRAASRA